MKSDDHAAEAEAFLKAFGNQGRLAILCNLQQGERSVSGIGDVVGMRQSTLSQHLARLRGDGLDEPLRQGVQARQGQRGGQQATDGFGSHGVPVGG